MAEPTGPDDVDLLAAEYVIGLLPPDEHASARRLAVEHAGFAAAVARWEERLTPLVLAVGAVPAPPAVWRRIATQLPPAPGAAPIRRERPARRLWDSVAVWRGAAAAAALAAASLAVVVFLPRPTPPAVVEPLAVARLQGQAQAAAFVVAFDRAGSRLIVTPTGAPLAADRSPELWLMPPGQTPTSLGLVRGDASVTLAAPAGLAADALLAVSLEPLGGSPTGLPTGPVLGQGRLSRL
jgi:anti-sigma-K factor RskA